MSILDGREDDLHDIRRSNPRKGNNPVGTGRNTVKKRPLLAGRYRVERALDAGGMARVFLAYQEPFGRPVAVKVLRAEYVDDEVLIQRFQQEAHTISQLTHPNTVRVYDSGQTSDGHLFIVMEFIEGQSLEHELRERGILTLDEAVTYTIQIAQALGEAHYKGIIHRDLKPANIMVVRPEGTDPFVKVLDFGIAKILDDERRWTDAGNIIGTPYYMAPEQAKQQDMDGRTDIYSLGCCLYEMLVGQPPFPGDSVMKVLMAHQQTPPPHLPDTYPAALDDLIQRTLSKCPEDRPRDTAAFIAQLMMSVVPGQEALSARTRPNTPARLSLEQIEQIDPGKHTRKTVETPIPHRPVDDEWEALAGPVLEESYDRRSRSSSNQSSDRALHETIDQPPIAPEDLLPPDDIDLFEEVEEVDELGENDETDPLEEVESPEEVAEDITPESEPRVAAAPTEVVSTAPAQSTHASAPAPENRTSPAHQEQSRSPWAIAIPVAALAAVAIVAIVMVSQPGTRPLEIESEPSNATVEINGVDVGKTPLKYEVADGEKLTLRFKRQGFEDKTVPDFEVRDKGSNRVFADLEPKLIDLEVSSEANATVRINGDDYGAISGGKKRTFSVTWPEKGSLRVEVQRQEREKTPFIEVIPAPKLAPKLMIEVPAS